MPTLNLHCQKCKSVIPDIDTFLFGIEDYIEVTEHTHLESNFCAACGDIDTEEYEEWVSNEPVYIDKGSSKVNPNQLSFFA